jgi:hypothetical protein
VQFMLAVPAIPWCCNKYLLRKAFEGHLPQEVVRRPKTPLARDPDYERARLWGMPKFPVTESLLTYVSPHHVPATTTTNIESFRTGMRAISLAFWLHNLELHRQRTTEVQIPALRSQWSAAGQKVQC